MKVIALFGLVAFEKVDLTVELASHFGGQGKRVVIIDNIARVSIDPERTNGEPLIWMNGNLLSRLPNAITQHPADVVIVAVSERVHTEDLVETLEDIRDTGVETVSVGLVDLRTCDCFPETRKLVERYAEVLLYMPYNLEEVITKVGG